MDDYSDVPSHSHPSADKSPNFRVSDGENNRVGQMSDTSSSSSDSDSDSDHNTTVIRADAGRTNGHVNGMHSAGAASKMSIPAHLLTEDLRLSESGSDSD